MKKTLISILFISVTFSQNNISYTIYTDTKSYPNVQLHRVIGSNLIVYEKNSFEKQNVSINDIYRIRIQEKRSNPSVGCCIGGVLLGGLIGLGMDSGSPSLDAGAGFISFLPITVLGGMGMGSLVGRIAGSSPRKSQNILVILEDKTLDEKIKYFKSRIRKQNWLSSHSNLNLLFSTVS